ncbi:hypothetical protein [Clostridium brassicae]|uniref:Uncharacterized protein n=1 Tax=Clostridium brassicae TaxID=2999072 RepID=A0ABT4DEQ1_9CLOT|nr:hypothetical protein [Clostridium brassicae]MCY6959661.1 hypothetical protein [Clostridium brassicae]
MIKDNKIKKCIATLCLLIGLVCINVYTSLAGTERKFWNMTIRPLQGDSVLTTRHKETDLQYSWVKVTKMQSIGKVNVKFVGPTWTITNPITIDTGVNTGRWYKAPYITGGSVSGSPIALSASNYNWSTSKGYIEGWVDYE